MVCVFSGDAGWFVEMELRRLRCFVMAAEGENISRAVARLNISQPAVSRQIKDLEEEFGVPLFERESNGLRLSSAGEVASPTSTCSLCASPRCSPNWRRIPS